MPGPTSALALDDLVEISAGVVSSADVLQRLCRQTVTAQVSGIKSQSYRVGGILVGVQMRCNADQKNSIFSARLQ